MEKEYYLFIFEPTSRVPCFRNKWVKSTAFGKTFKESSATSDIYPRSYMKVKKKKRK